MINPAYLSNWKVIQRTLKKEGSVSLHQFLLPDAYKRIQHSLPKLKREEHLLSHRYASAPIQLPELASFLSCHPLFTIFSFTWKDYTILHDNLKETKGTDIILDLTNNWPEEACGQIIYKGKEDIIIPAKGNTMTLVNTAGKIRYIKYVNHHGKGKQRVFLLGRMAAP